MARASTTLTPEEMSVAKVRLVLAEFIFLTIGEISGVFKKTLPKNIFPFSVLKNQMIREITNRKKTKNRTVCFTIESLMKIIIWVERGKSTFSSLKVETSVGTT